MNPDYIYIGGQIFKEAIYAHVVFIIIFETTLLTLFQNNQEGQKKGSKKGLLLGHLFQIARGLE